MEPPTTTNEEQEDHPKLHLFSLPSLRYSPDPTRAHHHDPPGARTPPLHTHASIPFLWEAVPGIPKEPCTTKTTTLTLQPLEHNPNNYPSPDPNPNSRALELPPRLLNEPKFTKTPSPTTVLEGPYTSLLGRSILESSSFRFLRSRRYYRGGSFDGGALSGGSSSSPDPERGLTSSGSFRKEEDSGYSSNYKGLFGSWRKKAGGLSFRGGRSKSSVVRGGSFVISSDGEDQVVGGRKKRLLRWSSSSKSHFWANIYGAFKQIIPKTSTTKWKKDGL